MNAPWPLVLRYLFDYYLVAHARGSMVDIIWKFNVFCTTVDTKQPREKFSISPELSHFGANSIARFRPQLPWAQKSRCSDIKSQNGFISTMKNWFKNSTLEATYLVCDRERGLPFCYKWWMGQLRKMKVVFLVHFARIPPFVWYEIKWPISKDTASAIKYRVQAEVSFSKVISFSHQGGHEETDTSPSLSP